MDERETPQGSGGDLVVLVFRYRGGGDPLRGLARALAQISGNAPGMIWKTWFVDERRREGGSLHLFRDAVALERWQRGPDLARLRNDRDVADLSVRCFRTLNEIPLIAIRRWDAREA